jgi:hypothetical protein
MRRIVRDAGRQVGADRRDLDPTSVGVGVDMRGGGKNLASARRPDCAGLQVLCPESGRDV